MGYGKLRAATNQTSVHTLFYAALAIQESLLCIPMADVTIWDMGSDMSDDADSSTTTYGLQTIVSTCGNNNEHLLRFLKRVCNLIGNCNAPPSTSTL